MKSYTDISQSKKLAEILPIESADMAWVSTGLGKPFARTIPIKGNPEELCACWSLAALLDVINTNYYTTLYHDGVAWNIDIIHHDNDKEKHNAYANTPIDACVEMIIELHDKNFYNYGHVRKEIQGGS